MLSLLTLDRPLVVIDCETTSLDVKAARIVELGFQLFEVAFPGDGPCKEWRSLVNPGVSIPAEATRVHKITNFAVQCCRTCNQVMPDHCLCVVPKPWPTFHNIAANLAKGFSNCDFAGKNVRYDLRVLTGEFARAGVEWSYLRAWIIDVDRLEQLGEPRRLSDLYRKYTNSELNGAHQALVDVRATTTVIAGQLEKYAKLPRNVRQLHQLQWPDWIDSEGKFRFIDGVPCFTRWGKYAGRPMRDIDVRYWDFILLNNFSADVKTIASAAKLGKFPVTGDY